MSYRLMKFKDLKVGMVFRNNRASLDLESYIFITKKDDAVVGSLTIVYYGDTHRVAFSDRQIPIKIWDDEDRYLFSLLPVVSKAGLNKLKKRIIRITA